MHGVYLKGALNYDGFFVLNVFGFNAIATKPFRGQGLPNFQRKSLPVKNLPLD